MGGQSKGKKLALSASGVEREYGIGRVVIVNAVRSGELPASRLGAKRLFILREDLEAWVRSKRVEVL
jgi:hypothetical protein